MEPYPYEAEELEELAFQAQHDLGWGDPARAARYCEELARHWAEVDGPDSERALVWRSMWGRALTEARRYPEAEAVLSDLVVDRTRVLGCDAPGTLVARGNLARAVALGGRPREGILLAEQLLADRQRVLGLDHPSTLDTRGHLAHFHHHLGDHATAVRMFTNLLATRERVLGPDHEVTRQTKVNLAVAMVRSDPTRVELEVLIDEVLDAGPDPDVLDPVMVALHAVSVEVMLAQGLHDEALAMIDAVIESTGTLFGAAAPQTLDAERTRAQVLVAAGARPEAIASLTGALERAEAAGTADTLAGLNCRADLVDLLVCRLTTVHAHHRDAFDDVVADLRRHQERLAAGAARLEPLHHVRCVSDDTADLLWALDDGAWDREDEEDLGDDEGPAASA